MMNSTRPVLILISTLFNEYWGIHPECEERSHRGIQHGFALFCPVRHGPAVLMCCPGDQLQSSLKRMSTATQGNSCHGPPHVSSFPRSSCRCSFHKCIVFSDAQLCKKKELSRSTSLQSPFCLCCGGVFMHASELRDSLACYPQTSWSMPLFVKAQQQTITAQLQWKTHDRCWSDRDQTSCWSFTFTHCLCLSLPGGSLHSIYTYLPMACVFLKR